MMKERILGVPIKKGSRGCRVACPGTLVPEQGSLWGSQLPEVAKARRCLPLRKLRASTESEHASSLQGSTWPSRVRIPGFHPLFHGAEASRERELHASDNVGISRGDFSLLGSLISGIVSRIEGREGQISRVAVVRLLFSLFFLLLELLESFSQI